MHSDCIEGMYIIATLLKGPSYNQMTVSNLQAYIGKYFLRFLVTSQCATMPKPNSIQQHCVENQHESHKLRSCMETWSSSK